MTATIHQLSDDLAARPTGRAAVLVAALLVVLPGTLLGLSSTSRIWVGDTVPVVATVVEQYRHGTRDLSGRLAPNPQAYRWAEYPPGEVPYFVRRVSTDSGVYSSYPAGMEVFTWPSVLAVDLLGGDIENDEVQVRIEYTTAAVVSGLALGLFFLTALHLGAPLAAAATTALLAIASVFVSTLSQLLWQQTGVVVWVLVVLWVELRSKGQPGWGGIVIQALAAGMMVACRPSATTFLVSFGLWVLVRDARRGVLFGAMAAVAFTPWAAMYWHIYHQPLGPATDQLGGSYTWSFAANVGGVLVSPGRGLFVYDPWMILLGLLAVPALRGDSAHRPIGWFTFGFAYLTLHVLLVGSWGCWWGGVCWGPRLAAEVVPVAGLMVVGPVGWLVRRRWGFAVLVALAVGGSLTHVSAVHGNGYAWYFDPADAGSRPERFWDWSDAPYLYDLRR